MANPLQLYMTYSFLRILTQPWEDTEAYKLGIIDEEGNVLKKSRELKTDEERKAYTVWHRLVWKLKRLLGKVPFGKTLLGSYIAALWLIKENVENRGSFDEILNEFCRLQGIDKTLLTEEATNEAIAPGAYIVTSKFLTGLMEHEIFELSEPLEPIGSLLGENVYSLDDGAIFSKTDIFPIDEEAVTTGPGISGTNGEDPAGGPSNLVRRSKFAGQEVFDCNDDVYHRCRLGKQRYHRYDKYVGDDETGQAIREYGLKNPGKPIIVKHDRTGAMMYLKHANNKFKAW